MQRPSFAIYDASAGSGKTYSLVKQYLKIILKAKKNDAYRNILAITFTNKAVHEMKSRIVGSLSEFAKDEPNQKAQDLMKDLVSGKRKENNPEEWEDEPIGLSVIEIKTKSQQIIKHIIHNYAAFDISTIDKFTHKVIRAFAHDLGLPMTFEVTLDTENLLTEAVDSLIAQAGEDVILTKLLIDFTMEKTDDDKSWDISQEIFNMGKLILNENNQREIASFKDKEIQDFIVIKNRLRETCEELESESINLANSALSLIENEGLEYGSFYSSYVPKHFLKLTNCEPFKHEVQYKYLEESEGKRYSAKTPQSQKEGVDRIANELLDILKKINSIAEKYSFYKAFLKNITPLSLLNTVSNELAKIQEEQNLLSISEFNALIHREIQNQPAPFIYERLGERYRHFFIDEFQDTSEMQWQNLIPLIDNATSSEIDGEKGTLMIVGDPKQSIYRWRGGKAEQFIALSKDQNPFNNPDKKIVHLDTNYRSYSEVIDFNNKFFKYISAEFENTDYKDLYENHSHQKDNNKKGGYVNISFLPEIDVVPNSETSGDEEDEDSIEKSELYVLATLKTIVEVRKKGFRFSDIAILIRHKKNGTTIANYLIEQGIPILSSETLLIKNASDVRLIIYVLKLLKSGNDLEAKAYFLEYLAQNSQDKMPVHDFIAHGMTLTKEIEFENWLESFDIKLSFQNIRKKSLYEAVEIIIMNVINAKSNSAYIQHFLDIVLERDVRNNVGISDFLDYWDKNGEKFKIPSPEGSDAVQIMTIHKSKGLEFPVVIFPFAEENYSSQKKDKIWLDAEEQDFGLPKVLINNNKEVENFGEKAKTVYTEKSQEQLLDNINVLYVALTRAEEQLYLISNLPKRNKEGNYPKNMATFFINYLEQEADFDGNQLEYDFGNPEKISPKSEPKDTLIPIPLVSEILNPKNIKIAQREALMWGTHQQESIEYGNLIHEILSFVKTKNDVDLAITKAIENGLITINQKETVYKTIQEIVNHQELSTYFSSGNEVLNEQTIIQKESTIIKPDRMVLTKNKEVYLLDYKTGVHQPKYKLQLDNYQAAIEKMGYKVVKKALVYIGERIDVVHL